jgi:hypothetical protein
MKIKSLIFVLALFLFPVMLWAGDVAEFSTEVNFQVTFDPSPDSRATGHNLYVTGPTPGKFDLKKEVVYIIPGRTLAPGQYSFTATAYGKVKRTVDGNVVEVEEESVHSDPLVIRIVDTEEPAISKPGTPKAIRVIDTE